jgi:ethanolamine utilization protein EutN
MIVARVEAKVVATVKHKAYQGRKILLLQPVERDMKPTGEPFLAIDFVQAGEGDIVLVAKDGGTARITYGAEAPVHSVIIGIIDEIGGDQDGG